PLNNGAWLVKNSWGSAWGDGGYFWISYEDTSFPIETFAVNGTVPYDSKTTVYEHEYTIASGSGYWLTDTNYYSRIYQLTNDNQILQQVRLFITEANLNVEVDVIPNFTSLRGYIANDFTARGSIISEYPGYYTIDLNQPIALGNSGTKFAVVVKVTGEESRIGYSAAPPNGGTAYRWSPNSDVWEEMNTNYIIKAVTITHEHSFGGWTLFSAATCVEDGQEKRNCSVCGLDETRVSSANKKLDHSFGNWATSVVATCTATGTETRTCSWDSSHKETRTIAAIGHNFGNWAVTSKATERAAGAQTRICANNSAHKETRPIAKLAYTVKNRVKCQYKVTVRANISVPCALSASADIDNSGIAFLPSNTARGYTCSEKLTMSDGSTRYRTGDYYFEYDGKTMSVEVLHSFGGWKTTTNATCKTAGKQNRTCPCGHKETRSVKKKAHSLKTTTTTKATAKKAGKSTTSCTACKTVTKTVAIPKIKSVKLAKTKYTYKGESIKPKVTVTNSNGKALKKGTDYTVTYSKGCKNVGEYTATINFKGKYTGKSQKTFTILPKGTKISSIGTKNGYTLNVKKQSKQTTGYEIQYSTDGNFKKNNKRVTVTKNTKNVAKLKANTYYYIRVRTYKTVKADGKSKKIYSPWSSNGWTKGGNVWRIRSDVGTRMHIVIR
ncbi:MAG: fibronectin type III domain-containing protein, partial [Oscillospiraceae bacterium]|nr:fibronectin type III domain-containing protein [Oscillospiraceae bacterium]